MASAAQVTANQANAQHSSGPVTPEGKAAVAANRITHGLTGTFALLPFECPDQFKEFCDGIIDETKPETNEEKRLVSSIIQHYWLVQRSLSLQGMLLFEGTLDDAQQKKLALLIRYQTTNERSYYKARHELQNLRKQKRAEQIGFESQKREQEAHEAKVRLTNARSEDVEIQNEVRQTVEVPLPGSTRIPFSDIQAACAAAIRSLAEENIQKSA
jgi:hypothetical protein